MKKQIVNVCGIDIPTTAMSKIIHKAGEIMLSAVSHEVYKEKEGASNFVTEYDVKVQNYLEAEFSKLIPGVSFFAEEEGQNENPITDALTFVIDPIDGTTNFVCNARASVISVALMYRKEVIFGAIYNPYDNNYYHAVKGQGAFCNGNKITVSTRPAHKALVAVGTSPYSKEITGRRTMEIAYDMLMAFSDLRRHGSAALEIALVACGECDAFMEDRLNPWDFGAGYLILCEAGGICTDFDGNPLPTDHATSTAFMSPTISDKVLEILRKHAKQ